MKIKNLHYLNDFVKALPCGVIAITGVGEIVMANETAIDLLNLTKSPIPIESKSIFKLMGDFSDFCEKLGKALQGELKSFKFFNSSLEETSLKWRGNWMEEVFVLFIEDVSEIKTIEKKALHATLEGQEQERRRIAQEIHDGLGPLFSSLTMHIESMEKVIQEKTPEIIFECSILRELSKTIAQDIRAISHDLMPSAVEDFGVATALENLCETTNEASKSDISFYCANMEETRLDENIELGLYRIGQELLNNALKYAKATNIVIQLIRHENSIVLMVEDDGVGFDKQLIKKKKKGIGWRNINTRTRSLGGFFNIDSREGEGFVATVEIPLGF